MSFIIMDLPTSPLADMGDFFLRMTYFVVLATIFYLNCVK